ncbi:MAG: contractile injection system tape measure protein, partial [Bacteroidota bacterium]|nr:contractile injection system tape measure protein [Bacteroidota bacterium]
PTHHKEVVSFSNQFNDLQNQSPVFQAGKTTFKKEVWFWILNYLLAERGTLFNKVAFMKSNIRQMAAHYNMAYSQLLSIIIDAADIVSKKSFVTTGFIGTLKLLSADKTDTVEKGLPKEQLTDHWSRLEFLFKDSSLRKTPAAKNEFNELLTALHFEDKHKFAALLASIGYDKENWTAIIAGLNNTAVKAVLFALNPGKADVLIESIRLLDGMCKSAGLRVNMNMLWGLGVEFVYAHQKTSFDNKIFLTKCLSAIAGRVENKHVFGRLAGAGIPANIRTTQMLEVYTDLVESYGLKIQQNKPATLAYFAHLINAIARQLVHGRDNREALLPAKRLLIKNIAASPVLAVKALLIYPDKGALKRMLNFIGGTNVVNLLIKAYSGESSNTLMTFGEILRDEKVRRAVTLPGGLHDDLMLSGLKLLLVQPGISPSSLMVLMLKSIKNISGLSLRDFEQLAGELLSDNRLAKRHIRPMNATNILNRLNKPAAPCSIEKILKLSSLYPAMQEEVGALLADHFSQDQFVRLRRVNGGESASLLNYFITDGKQLMNRLVVEFTRFLQTNLKETFRPGTEQTLRELYWQCILNYGGHTGNIALLKRAFIAAVTYTFPVFPRRAVAIKSSTGGKQSKVLLRGRNKISHQILFSLIAKCINSGSSGVDHGAITYQLSELLAAGLEASQGELRRIIKGGPVSEKRMAVVKAAITFNDFSLWIVNDTHGALKEHIMCMRSLFALLEDILPSAAEDELANLFWMQAWKQLKTNKWGAADLETLIRDSLKILTRMNVDSSVIAGHIAASRLELDPVLKDGLSKFIPGIGALTAGNVLRSKSEILIKFEQKEMLYELTCFIVAQKQIPSWLGGLGEVDAAEALGQIISYHPATFLAVLKREVISEPQMQWLVRSVKFAELVKAIVHTHNHQQLLLNILRSFYAALGTVTIHGITAASLQEIVFRKVLKAWVTGNWRPISTTNIWNELTWDVCTKRGVSATAFFKGIESEAQRFPPALQTSFIVLNDLPKKNARVGNTIEKIVMPVSKQRLRQKALPTIERSGIPVRNAGMVLLSTYIPMLFERIGLTESGKFKNNDHQLDAVHYLQYVVTGLSQTEEQFLVLNKTICGMPLSNPIREGITLSANERILVDGLIKAAIGYWPAIGNCSIDGFRGNWLVRDGLLTEFEDKWELTVEKRSYDILIHKSPFSFSIIKYPWMAKPLHVTWPY